MACYYPIEAYQSSDGEIRFVERGDISRVLQLPCGQCVGCRLERSRQWAVRIMHEAKCHEASCFLTLTYDDEHLPYRGQLVYRHFQLFMKKLRLRYAPLKLRFYACGEYGEHTFRPHYHCCLFGTAFYSDRKEWKDSGSGYPLYISESLDALWNKGHAYIGDLSWDSAGYVARYCLKKVTGKGADAHYERVDEQTGEVYYLPPEFAHMSLKPGIGSTWFNRYGLQEVGIHNRVIMNGVSMDPPKYYRRLLKEADPESAEYVDYLNARRARNPDDSTYVRLRDREAVTKARLKFKFRSLS